MGAQSGGRRTPRFDMGTDCGPQYVDVQVVALPGPRASYANDLAALKAAVRLQAPATVGQRNVLVLADRMSSSPAGYWSGIGESYVDESTSAPHSQGGLFAALWVPDLEPAPGADPDGWWAEGMLHEMTHNLGAVGDSAPHSSGYGHCYDGYDVMCYHDHPAAPAMTYPCPRIAGVMSQVYDCGGDDYFNVAPAAGSYLATHWNTFDNRFLAACDERAPGLRRHHRPRLQPDAAGLHGRARDRGRAAGRLERSPRSPGSWTNAPLSFEYQWEQGDGTTWLAVPGETGSTYAVTEDDAELRLRVRVIAVNGDGRTAAYSAPTAPVADPSARLRRRRPRRRPAAAARR